jgi:HNH endonuclease/AP2 domain
MTITQELIRETFDYQDGKLIWKKSKKTDVVGKVAGAVGGRGYVDIKINGKIHKAHRLIYILHHGHAPEMIDHRDCDKTNNRIENLRPATVSQNVCNREAPANSTSGIKGVRFHQRDKKWIAYAKINGKQKHLGTFESVDAAAIAATAARKELHGEYAHG